MSIYIKQEYYVFILFLCFFHSISGQKKKYSAYYMIKMKYDYRSENDTTALPLVSQYICKAKAEKNFSRLAQGYKDGIAYSENPNNKLQYADSLIWAAQLSKNDSLIDDAYVSKGVVYYFNFKKYKLALDEYLKAYEYAKNSSDLYHKNRLNYLIGVVKSYIGYYDEALVVLKQTSSFFELESRKNMHPNVLYGNMRGYYNSLHQMIVCYRSLGNYNSADSLTAVGLSSTTANKEYQQEYGYFLKEQGIADYHRKDYNKSIQTLTGSLKYITKVNDFAWEMACYYYIGKSYKRLGDINSAKQYFQKVDSVFQKHDFILPELRNNYEQLIELYKAEKNKDEQLYYTDQLLKADRTIDQDFAYLSTKIHRQYDTRALLEEKSRLEKNSVHSTWKIWLLTLIITVLSAALLWKFKAQLQDQLKRITGVEQNNDDRKGDLDRKVIDELLVKLKDFEKNLGFIETGLTLNKLADKFNTNSTYLSQTVNEHKGTNFTTYIGELRIRYITSKLYEDKKYLNYKIGTLAQMCGIASRSNFSELFQKINGRRPADFIKQLLEDSVNKKDL